MFPILEQGLPKIYSLDCINFSVIMLNLDKGWYTLVRDVDVYVAKRSTYYKADRKSCHYFSSHVITF